MKNSDYRISRGFAIFWAIVGLMCFISAVVAGAYWHLFTCAICVLFFFVHHDECEEYREELEELRRPRS